MLCLRTALAAALVLAMASTAGAQVKAIVVDFGQEVPEIDGVLREAAWQSAVVTKGFLDVKTKQPAKRQTEVRILMTSEGLFFGATLHDDAPSKVVAEKRPHDLKIWQDDTFEVFRYPTRIEGDYFHFLMNPQN